MNIRIIAIVSLLFLSAPSLAQTSSSKAATTIFEKFLASFTNADVEGIVGLFSEDALFWGTGSQTLVQDTDGIRAYFSGMNGRRPGERTASALEHSVLVLSDTEAVISGMWQVVPSGQTTGTPLRVSVAVAQRNGQWKIVQFHNSRVPE